VRSFPALRQGALERFSPRRGAKNLYRSVPALGTTSTNAAGDAPRHRRYASWTKTGAHRTDWDYSPAVGAMSPTCRDSCIGRLKAPTMGRQHSAALATITSRGRPPPGGHAPRATVVAGSPTMQSQRFILATEILGVEAMIHERMRGNRPQAFARIGAAETGRGQGPYPPAGCHPSGPNAREIRAPALSCTESARQGGWGRVPIIELEKLPFAARACNIARPDLCEILVRAASGSTPAAPRPPAISNRNN